MISRKSGPPRPPLPTRVKKLETSSQQQQEETQKSLGRFSIRYSRDDANESDEEISIVRKEDSPDVQSESNGESENAPAGEHGVSTSPNPTGTSSSGTNSILSAFNLPFLSKTPTSNSGREASSFEEQTQKEPCPNSMGEIVFKTSHFEQESDASPASLKEMDDSGRVSTSPPVSRRKENPVVHSAMSLSSLLKKEVQDKAHFGRKGSSPEGKGHVEVPKTKGFLASALADSSRLLMPIGLGDFNTEVGTSAKGEKPVLTYTEVPLYNILLVSAVIFLYFMLPSSSFMNGLVFGGILTFFLVFALMWLLTPEMSDEEKYKRDVLEHDREMQMLQETESGEHLQRLQLNPQQDLEVRNE